MQVTKNIEIYAIYGEETVEAEAKPVIAITNISISSEGEKNKLTYSVTRDVV